MVDAFGEALTEYFDGLNTNATEVIRRDDGYYALNGLHSYFRNYSEWPEIEKKLLNYVEGSILDIGGGAGRHALCLQEQGLEVHVIDISPLAVKLMKERGIKNVSIMDARKLYFPNHYFDTILMMGNNFGLGGTIKGTKELLQNLSQISTHSAKIIATIRDPRKTDNPKHLVYCEENIKNGRPYGQVKIRIEYQDKVGDWFYLLMVSLNELDEILQGTDWIISTSIKMNDSAVYGVMLNKRK